MQQVSSTSSLQEPSVQPVQRGHRPQSAPANKVRHVSYVPDYRSAPSPSSHRTAPRLPPQSSKGAVVIGKASGSFSRIAAALRDEVESATTGAKDSKAAGRRAAWLSDLSSQVAALRTLQPQFEPDAQLAESDSQNYANETLQRRANEILQQAQQQLDRLLLELDAKEKSLRAVRRQAEESEAKRVTAQRLLLETQKREHLRRLEARTAVDNQRYAEAKLRACELELVALKEAHDQLQYRSALAEYIRMPDLKEGTTLDMQAVDAASAYRLKPKLAVFAEACKLERVLVAAVQKALADGGFGKAAAMDGDVALQYLKGLESKQAIAKLVATPLVADALITVVWEQVQALK